MAPDGGCRVNPACAGSCPVHEPSEPVDGRGGTFCAHRSTFAFLQVFAAYYLPLFLLFVEKPLFPTGHCSRVLQTSQLHAKSVLPEAIIDASAQLVFGITYSQAPLLLRDTVQLMT
jgi:hypothetical protein